MQSNKHSLLGIVGASLIASCKTSCAQQQEHAELESMRLALGLACLVRSLLQQLDMDQLEHDVHITLKTSSWKEKLVPGRPIAQQLGLSRRNKHQQLKGQLQFRSARFIPTRILHTACPTMLLTKRCLLRLGLKRKLQRPELCLLCLVNGQLSLSLALACLWEW